MCLCPCALTCICACVYVCLRECELLDGDASAYDEGQMNENMKESINE